MGARRPLLLRAPLLLAALALVSACRDRDPVIPPADAVPREVSVALRCRATVRPAALRCDAAAPGTSGNVRGNIVLGSQHLNVRLTNEPPTYDGSTLATDVSVQNLLDQRMGTPDGTTVYGVKVFFHTGPDVTARTGPGEVTVLNPDDVATFTGTTQPYFHYEEILQPRGTSSAKPWEFAVPGTVDAFEFTVYVETQLQSEGGILRWRRERGAATNPVALNAAWAVSPRSLFVVGEDGHVLHWDASTWTTIPTGTDANLVDVWGSGARNVYAAAEDARVLRYDGNDWSEVRSGDDGWMNGVGGSASAGVLAVGARFDDDRGAENCWIVRSGDAGGSWDDVYDDWTGTSGDCELHDVWAHGDTVIAVGENDDPDAGTVHATVAYSTDGGGTWSTTNPDHHEETTLLGVWGADDADVWAVGFTVDSDTEETFGLVQRSTDGGATWTPETSSGPEGERYLTAVWGSSATDVYASGFQLDGDGAYQGVVLHFDGAAWSEVGTSGLACDDRYLYGMAGTGAGAAFAVGSDGVVLATDGVSLEEALATACGRALNGVWGSGSSSVVAVGFEGLDALVSRWNGSGWTETLLPGGLFRTLYGVSGSGGTVLAVGEEADDPSGVFAGLVLRSTDDGLGWTPSTHPAYGGTEDRTLNAVWMASVSEAFAVGVQSEPGGDAEGVILHSTDGGTGWSETTSAEAGAFRALYAVWGTGPSEAWAVGGHDADGLILAFDGADWTATVVPRTAGAFALQLFGVSGTSSADVYAVGTEYTAAGVSDGVILHWDGATWTRTTIPGSFIFGGERGLFAAAALPSGYVHAFGANGTVLRLSGGAWIPRGGAVRTDLYGGFLLSPTSGYAVGDGKAILRGAR